VGLLGGRIRDDGFGIRSLGSGFRVQDFGSKVEGVHVCCLLFRVQGFGCETDDLDFILFWRHSVYCLWFRVSGVG